MGLKKLIFVIYHLDFNIRYPKVLWEVQALAGVPSLADNFTGILVIKHLVH